MITETHRPSLVPTVLGAAAGAYLIPAVTTAVNALFIPDPAVSERLAVAAWTTLGVPSAAAAVLATIWFHSRSAPVSPSAAVTVRAFAWTAAFFALLAGGGTAVLIGNGLLDPASLQFTMSAAAMGGGITARRWARTNRRSRKDPR
jgi:hypothetical protein